MAHHICSCIESQWIAPDQFYGRFVLGRFAPGQGLTVANSLRRSLLSELTGAAIIFVHIENALHEYETLPGIEECVLDILLNLKALRLTAEFDHSLPQVAYVHLKGPKVIRAKDLKLPYFTACVNPQHHIATLSEKGQLTMRLLIGFGKGQPNHAPYTAYYQSCVQWINRPAGVIAREHGGSRRFTARLNGVEKAKPKTKPERSRKPEARPERSRKPETKPETKKSRRQTSLRHGIPSLGGYFPLNNTYGPILKVNYSIQARRYRNEKVYLEIWTDGSVDPRHVLNQAVQNLIQLFLPMQQTKRLSLTHRETHYVYLKTLQGALHLNQSTFQNIHMHRDRCADSFQTRLNSLRALDEFTRASQQQIRENRQNWNDERVKERSESVRPTLRQKRRRKRLKLRPNAYMSASNGIYFVKHTELNAFSKRILLNLRQTDRGSSTLFSIDLLNLDLDQPTVAALKQRGLGRINQLFKPNHVLRDQYGLASNTVEAIDRSLLRYVERFVRNFRPTRVPSLVVGRQRSNSTLSRMSTLGLNQSFRSVPGLALRKLYLEKLEKTYQRH